MPFFYYFDPTYILVIIGFLITLIASLICKATFSSFSKKLARRGITANEAAERILHSAGIYDVTIGKIRGNMTDHYNPKTKQLNLSDTVYGKTSIAAIGVAAHECGHAIQHAEKYSLLALRSAAVPVANIGSWFSWPVIVIGIIIGSTQLANIGIILFCAVVAFQLITLPVEINASTRATRVISECGLLDDDELTGAKKVLVAAAFTYVAALASTLLQLLRLVLIVNGRRK